MVVASLREAGLPVVATSLPSDAIPASRSEATTMRTASWLAVCKELK